ncbi:hypothetical protein C8R31_10369 [Nitrosospira sp. Nsp2]|nr:hypothetical protein C8R31_10369 [Nitrosospira sp. Nsp2]
MVKSWLFFKALLGECNGDEYGSPIGIHFKIYKDRYGCVVPEGEIFTGKRQSMFFRHE